MAWVVVLVVSWLSAGRAWANSAALPVSFDVSGQALQQAEIRVAIATELGREVRADDGAGDESRERVLVAVDELGQLWVRYWGPRGLVDRHLTMPGRPEQVPLVISLSVGNLVRQEAFELLREIEQRRAREAKPVEPAKSTPPSASAAPSAKPPVAMVPQPPLPERARPPRPSAPAKPKNSWGHYLVEDFAYFPTESNVCRADSNVPCYDQDFTPIELESEGTGVAGGLVAADARYVMAYARQLTPQLWGAVRVGFAFSGGKGKDKAAQNDAAQPKFMPWLLELRLQGFLGQGAFGGALRPFVHATAGLAEVSAEVQLQAPFGGDGRPIAGVTDRGPLTAIHAMGLLFTGGGLGLSVELFEHLRVEPELSGFVAFPSYGWFARPSIGLTYDL